MCFLKVVLSFRNTSELSEYNIIYIWLLHWKKIYICVDQMKKKETEGACGTHAGYEKFIHDFCGETWRKRRRLKTSKHRWKNNASKDISGLGQKGMHWIHLAQDKGILAGSCQSDNEQPGFIKFVELPDEPKDYQLHYSQCCIPSAVVLNFFTRVGILNLATPR